MRNLRFATRLLLRQPLFTLTAVLSMAIGIGANSAIFTAINSLLFSQPPGVSDYAAIVDIGRTRNGSGFDTVGYQTYLDVKARATGFAGIVGYRMDPQPLSLAGTGSAERIFGQQVSDNYFEVLGIRPHLGRLFVSGDDRLGVKNPIVVLTHPFWQSRFQGDPAMAGKVITLNGEPFQVVGVAPEGFGGTSIMTSDVFVPLTAGAPGLADDNLLRGRGNTFMMMLGRLAPGGSAEQAQAGLDVVMAQLQKEYPDVYRNRGLEVRSAARFPGMTAVIGGFMGVLMALVGLVLLIACVNLAGMQLARATARTREIAVRLSLGASRRQIVGQLLSESVLLCAAGGVLGIIAGRWMLQGLLALLPPPPFPLGLEFSPDLRVVLFTAAAALAAGIITGLAPALQTTKPSLVPALKDDARAPAKLRLRHVFVAGQLALSIVLLLAAMLLLRAFKSALDVDPGFEPSRIVAASLNLSIAGYTEESAQPFYRQLLTELRAIPGAENASIAVTTPLDGGRFGMGGIRVPGRQEQVQADWNIVSPGFFETLRLPIAHGRAFMEGDRAGAAKVAIVNESFVRATWPGEPVESAIGRQLGIYDNQDVQIVGIARDARLYIIGERPSPFIFVPLYQHPFMRAEVFVRHSDQLTTASMMTPVRQVVARVNPYLPVVAVSDLSEVAAFGLVPQRLAATLAGALGITGLLLAAVGLYGLMAYAVASRTREIGIRQALGADQGTVLRMFLRQGMKLAAIGSAIGMALGIVLAFAIQSLLFGVSPLDPLAMGITVMAMLGVGVVATYLPARKASAIAPLLALRHDN